MHVALCISRPITTHQERDPFVDWIYVTQSSQWLMTSNGNGIGFVASPKWPQTIECDVADN